MMNFRKGLVSICLIFALISTDCFGLEIAGIKLPSFKKTAYTRTRGEPIRHDESQIAQGKFLKSKRHMKSRKLTLYLSNILTIYV